MMSSDEILFGLGLVVVLAVGAQLLSRRLGLPAIVLLLPAGFAAGVATDDEAGLRLSFAEVARELRSVVGRLIVVGIAVSWVGIAATVALLFPDMNLGVAGLIGAILVVSGPTVVLPLLAFIRPTAQVRSLLKWEGVLVEAVGATLGVLVFLGVQSASAGGTRWRPGEFLVSLGVGVLVGALGGLALWLLLREAVRNAPDMVVPATLMVVVGAVVAADLLREDAGLAAATVMGMALANQERLTPLSRIDISPMLEFHETLVRLLIGVLFVLVAASVSPGDVEAVLPQALVLVAVMVVLIRPAGVMLGMWRTPFAPRERAFV